MEIGNNITEEITRVDECNKNEEIDKPYVWRIYKAADGNRTRDLRTTNATLYRLSHSSL